MLLRLPKSTSLSWKQSSIWWVGNWVIEFPKFPIIIRHKQHSCLLKISWNVLTYLLNKRKTTQIMINISAITTRIKYIAGLTLLAGVSSFSFIAKKWNVIKFVPNMWELCLSHQDIPRNHLSLLPAFFRIGRCIFRRDIQFLVSRPRIADWRSNFHSQKQLSKIWRRLCNKSCMINDCSLTFAALVDVISWHIFVTASTVGLVTNGSCEATLLSHFAFVPKL